LPYNDALAHKPSQCKCCTKTAEAAYQSARSGAQDAFWLAVAESFNFTNPSAASAIWDMAKADLKDAFETAKVQKEARLEVCEKLGEGPYDPVIVPNDFVDFAAVVADPNSFTPNPFFPLMPGTTWKYQTLNDSNEIIEKDTVEVLAETREIIGVNCIVVHDIVHTIVDGNEILLEDTIDWFAQKKDGTVWYFGEEAKQFEDGVLIGIEGSWMAGRDFAKPGIVMLANPQKGNFYRQEFLLGEAEDVAKVLSRGKETVVVPAGTFTTDVLNTKDTSPLEPTVVEFKFYAPGKGLVLTTTLGSSDREVLVEMTP
jgi:hypothetical protein